MRKYPLISVCVITFNHERYIMDCLNGIFRQDYPNIEIVISNDCSSDRTHQKISKFISELQEPNRFNIKYFNQEINLGINPNLSFALEQCHGEYVAICEGDDYWISNNKLTTQLNSILGTRYSACFHDVKYKKEGLIFDSFINQFSGYSISDLEFIKLKDLLQSKWLIPTCSFFFKKEVLDLPNFYHELKWGDFPLFCSISTVTDVYLVKGIEAVYRMDNPSSQINLVSPLSSIVFSIDMIRFLTWLKSKVDIPEVDERIFFQMRKSRNEILSFQNSTIYRIVSFIQNFISKYYYRLRVSKRK
ncbi:glycosyltransferase family 2 protein [Algoriphagus sp.]|uniref:glycosyltransferase family 2 protein n=1 Tax=Algoriphagus sp. TaxID=1872435 RepID=UPI003F6F8724